MGDSSRSAGGEQPQPLKLPGMVRLPGEDIPTFTPPRLTDLTSFNDVIDHHLHHSQEHVIFAWRTGSDGGIGTANVHEVTFSQYGRAIHRVARRIGKTICNIDLDQGEKPSFKNSKVPPSVAFVVSADHQSFLATFWGTIRAGLRAYAISSNNSDIAIANLLKARKCSHIVISRQGVAPELSKTTMRALDILRKENPAAVPEILEIFTYDELFAARDVDDFKPLPPLPLIVDPHETILTLHSSGSTNFPKPIDISNYSMILNLRNPSYSNFDFATYPTFLGHFPYVHALFLMASNALALGAGALIILQPPLSPPPPPSPSSVLSQTDSIAKMLILPPALLDLYANSEANVRVLSRVAAVGYGGGPLSRQTGDFLLSKGVRLMNFYAATETNWMLRHDEPTSVPGDWQYIRNTPCVATYFRSQSDSEQSGLYELVVGKGPHYQPNVINCTYEGKDAYATSDLVELKPGTKDTYRIFGRTDDQIMLSTGEKTNPGPLVGIIGRNPNVKSVLYVGRGRSQNAILVEPRDALDPSDQSKLAAFRNAIWPTVCEANDFAPKHSYIFKELILVAKMSKPFARSAKGSLQSGFIERDYADEIEEVYRAQDESGQLAEGLKSLSVPSLQRSKGEAGLWLNFVARVVSVCLTDSSNPVKDLDHDADIFQQGGADSLRATKIRNTVSALVNKGTQADQPSTLCVDARSEKKIAPFRLPSDFVYQHPTIRSMAAALEKAVKIPSSDKPVAGVDVDLPATKAAMEAFVQKYTGSWPSRSPALKQKGGKQENAYLITGTTGGLGAHLLEQSLRLSSVSKVYALNRGGKKSLHERQEETFRQRGLDASLLQSPRLALLEGKLDAEKLGLKEASYDELRESVTAIYHTAWRLDFNLSLLSFEEHIAGTRNLADLALSAPLSAEGNLPSLLFASSIGVLTGHDAHKEPLAPEAAVDFDVSAHAGGYGQAKAVTERILERARDEAGLPACNVRICQLSGSTTNGSWAITDWVPLIVKSAETLKCLPSAPGMASWTPTDVCATAMLDLMQSRDYLAQTRHISPPKASKWDTLMGAIASDLDVPLVPCAEWLAHLEEASATTSRDDAFAHNPALKLLGFYQALVALDNKIDIPGQQREAFGMTAMSSAGTCEQSKALRELAPFGAKDALQWLSYWRSQGFIKHGTV